MEIAVALLLFALGALVVFDSYRLGSRWGADGPRSRLLSRSTSGCIICISSAVTLGQALFGHVGEADASMFVEWQTVAGRCCRCCCRQRSTSSASSWSALYVASAIYIAGFMIWLGKLRVVKSASLGLGVSAVSFVTFEVWFQVPLFKGVLRSARVSRLLTS